MIILSDIKQENRSTISYDGVFSKGREIASRQVAVDPLGLRETILNTVDEIEAAIYEKKLAEKEIALIAQRILSPLGKKLTDLRGEPLSGKVLVIGEEVWEETLFDHYCRMWRRCYPDPVSSPVAENSWNLSKDVRNSYLLANEVILWMRSLPANWSPHGDRQPERLHKIPNRQGAEDWLLDFAASVRHPLHTDTYEEYNAVAIEEIDNEEEERWESHMRMLCHQLATQYSSVVKERSDYLRSQVNEKEKALDATIGEQKEKNSQLQTKVERRRIELGVLSRQQEIITRKIEKCAKAKERSAKENIKLQAQNEALSENYLMLERGFYQTKQVLQETTSDLTFLEKEMEKTKGLFDRSDIRIKELKSIVLFIENRADENRQLSFKCSELKQRFSTKNEFLQLRRQHLTPVKEKLKTRDTLFIEVSKSRIKHIEQALEWCLNEYLKNTYEIDVIKEKQLLLEKNTSQINKNNERLANYENNIQSAQKATLQTLRRIKKEEKKSWWF